MATTKKSAPVATVAKSAPAPATVEKPKEAVPALQAPRYVVGPWPQKSASGNSIRAYCYSVAKKLEKQSGPFTLRELASAFAANSEGTTFKQPTAGWGTAQKPNGNAMNHANYFSNEKQGWLSVYKPEETPAPAPAPAPTES